MSAAAPSPRTPPQWRPGETVGRYSLLAKIATGGMAEIWLADQGGLKGFNKLVVIKRILESFSNNPDFVSMFLDEARIAAQLNHPNIVQIFDLGEHAGAYYIAMEYLEGDTLAAVAREGIRARKQLPVPLAARLMSEAAAGLGHAHTKSGNDGESLGIVHRDVSPQNLIVTLDGHAKVVDFGVARAANRATHTSDGQIKGKMAYMAPEQAMGGIVDARSDVFALGVILFEVTTSTRFYPSPEMARIVGMLCSSAPLPRASERNPSVSESLSQIIDKALSRGPDHRYANGSELHAALDEWLHGRDENVGVAAVEAYLKDLFGAKWGKRTEVIEGARAGLLTPSGLRKNLAREAAVTMPGNTPGPTSPSLPVAGFPKWIFALVPLGAAAVVGLTAAWKSFSAPTATVATVIELPSAPPVAELPSVIRVETEPVGAVVSIDGLERGPAPVEVSGLRVGEHLVVARMDGRLAVERRVSLRAAGDHAQVMLALSALPSNPAPKPDKGPRPVAVAKGTLTLQTIPVTEVFLGNKSLGEAPLIDFPLPAGTHTLKLVNSTDGTKVEIVVEIVAGKTTFKKLRLNQ